MAGFSLFTDLISPTSYKVPDAPQIDINQEIAANNATNYTSFQQSKQLATDYNAFMREQVAKSLKDIPGFADLSSTLAKNLAAQLRGELSTSDAASVQRSSAARALGLGIAGSPAGAALTARDLGLTQYQVQQGAQAQTPGYLTSMRNLTAAPQFDFSSVFMTPAQRIQVSQWNKTNQFNVQNLRNQMAVQPEPWMKALAGFGDSLLTAAGSYFTMGGFGGTGGGGANNLGNLGLSNPQGWNQLSPFDQSVYYNSALQGRMAGYGMNFE